MTKNVSRVTLVLFLILFLMGAGAFRPDGTLVQTVHAQDARFDHITIVSPLYLHQGQEGLLLLDKRNGNVWFMPRKNQSQGSYDNPRFLFRVPFEQLDSQPR